MAFKFYYDETEHSRKISQATIENSNYYENFITVIVGWNENKEDALQKRYDEFEGFQLKLLTGCRLMSEIREKNELDYICGLSDDELTQRFIESVRIDEEIRKIKRLPTSGYDADL